VPAAYGPRLRNDEDLGPTGPDTAQADPEQPVQRIQPSARLFSFEHGELLPRRKHLDCVVLSSRKEDSHGGEGNRDEFKHGTLRSTMSANRGSRLSKLLTLLTAEVLATDRWK